MLQFGLFLPFVWTFQSGGIVGDSFDSELLRPHQLSITPPVANRTARGGRGVGAAVTIDRPTLHWAAPPWRVMCGSVYIASDFHTPLTHFPTRHWYQNRPQNDLREFWEPSEGKHCSQFRLVSCQGPGPSVRSWQVSIGPHKSVCRHSDFDPDLWQVSTCACAHAHGHAHAHAHAHAHGRTHAIHPSSLHCYSYTMRNSWWFHLLSTLLPHSY